MERFVFILLICLHEYNENLPENRDLWRQDFNWRVPKNEYLDENGDFLSHDSIM